MANKNYKEKFGIIKLKEVETPAQTISINGVEQVIKSKLFALCCPNCGRVVYQFPQQVVAKSIVLNEITNSKEQLEKIATYCPGCGIRLNYDIGIISSN